MKINCTEIRDIKTEVEVEDIIIALKNYVLNKDLGKYDLEKYIIEDDKIKEWWLDRFDDDKYRTVTDNQLKVEQFKLILELEEMFV